MRWNPFRRDKAEPESGEKSLPSQAVSRVPSDADASHRPLGAKDLSEIGLQALYWKPADGFDELPNLATVENRRFEIIQKPAKHGPENDAFDGWSGWSYWSNDRRLEASWSASQLISYDLRHLGQKVLPSELANSGRNPFLRFRTFDGVRRILDGQTQDIMIAIGRLGDLNSDPLAWLELGLDPAEARLLSQHLLVRISGTLEHWPMNRAVICGEANHQIFPEAPIVKKAYAIFQARTQKVEFFDDRTGQAIAFNRPK